MNTQTVQRDPRDEIDQRDGEATTVATMLDTAAMPAMLRAEIDSQIATARQYPRNVRKAMENIVGLATMDEETAAECLYALVRRKKNKGRNPPTTNAQPDGENKAIEGPSIRLAEVAAQCWGNCRIEAHVVTVNRQEKYVEAVGTFHDLETNMASTATVRRNIATASGYLFSADMITVTGNAACAIAKRNAILAGIPRGVYRGAYQAARGIVAGTIATLPDNRAKAIKAFAAHGVTVEQILELLDLESEGDIKVNDIATLRALFSTIKNGEATVEEVFAKPEKQVDPNHNPLVKQQTAERSSSDKPQDGDSSQVNGADDSVAEETPSEKYARLLRSFSDHLGKVTGTPRDLRTAATEWHKENGNFETGTPIQKASQQLFTIHTKRIAGELSGDELATQIKEVLAS